MNTKTILTYHGELQQIDEPTLREIGTLLVTKRGNTLVIMLSNVQVAAEYGYVVADTEYKGKFFLTEDELEHLIENGEYTVKGQ